MEFIARLFPKNLHVMVVEVLTETKALIQSYLLWFAGGGATGGHIEFSGAYGFWAYLMRSCSA